MWGLCWMMGAKQALTGQRLCVGSVGCWWAAGGLWKVLATISWLCIAGAFTKFAIFENRIFFQTSRSQVKFVSTDFVFFSRFWYITLNNKVLCGLMVGERNNLWRGEDHVEALWANGGYTSPDGAKALCGLCGLMVGCWWDLTCLHDDILVVYCGRVS